jgi:hypothetical protein
MVSVELKSVKTSDVHLNDDNPRTIKPEKFQQLVESVKEFPEMLEIREVVVDEDMMVLGGNMRFQACMEAGIKKLNVRVISGLTEEQKKEFIIKDNANYGDWDWDMLGNSFDEGLLKNWGLNVWQPDEHLTMESDEPIDTDTQDLDTTPGGDSSVDVLATKVIQLEFQIGDYQEALELVTELRSKGYDVGELLIESMKKAIANGN